MCRDLSASRQRFRSHRPALATFLRNSHSAVLTEFHRPSSSMLTSMPRATSLPSIYIYIYIYTYMKACTWRGYAIPILRESIRLGLRSGASSRANILIRHARCSTLKDTRGTRMRIAIANGKRFQLIDERRQARTAFSRRESVEKFFIRFAVPTSLRKVQRRLINVPREGWKMDSHNLVNGIRSACWRRNRRKTGGLLFQPAAKHSLTCEVLFRVLFIARELPVRAANTPHPHPAAPVLNSRATRCSSDTSPCRHN